MFTLPLLLILVFTITSSCGAKTASQGNKFCSQPGLIWHEFASWWIFFLILQVHIKYTEKYLNNAAHSAATCLVVYLDKKESKTPGLEVRAAENDAIREVKVNHNSKSKQSAERR